MFLFLVTPLLAFRFNIFRLCDPVEVATQILLDLLFLTQFLEISARLGLFSFLREFTANGSQSQDVLSLPRTAQTVSFQPPIHQARRTEQQIHSQANTTNSSSHIMPTQDKNMPSWQQILQDKPSLASLRCQTLKKKTDPLLLSFSLIADEAPSALHL